MYLRSLSLQHIRSYESLDLEFSKGTILLSGDIGSGKSTILLALEFALFGILRGKISPEELLRHGAKEGKVTLSFVVDNKEVVITRFLKRSGQSIIQIPGQLVVDGREESLVATELKARILALLGYPENLLSKSTNLFRYTIYTPQEQVKQILFESVEERKDIIRKIFSIDKYKIVSENIIHYVSDLRERIERLKGQTDDIKTLQEQLQAYTQELLIIENRLPQLVSVMTDAKEKRLKAEKTLETFRQDQISLQKAKSDFKLAEHAYDQVVQFEKRDAQRILELQSSISKMDVKEVSFDVEKKKKVVDALEKINTNKTILHRRLGELEARRKNSLRLSEQINSLDECPTCKQHVGLNHKEHIQETEKNVLEELKKDQLNAQTQLQTMLEKELKLKQMQDVLYQQEQAYHIYLEKTKQKNVMEEQLLRLKEQQGHYALQKNKQFELVEKAKERVEVLHQKINQKEYLKGQELLVVMQDEERKAELSHNEMITRQQVTKKMSTAVEETLHRKKLIQKEIAQLLSVRTWLMDLFIPLVKTIEKRVLLSVYTEFNAYFTKWFGALLEDQSLQVRLDEEFTPVLQQNGFDTSIDNLSGGEKTSVALAYRLALNKVVNNYFSSLQTKGVLILDEPTDGFSTEQLDTLRDVFTELGVEQLIIVSHEAKMEQLASSVIRVQKENHTSFIIE